MKHISILKKTVLSMAILSVVATMLVGCDAVDKVKTLIGKNQDTEESEPTQEEEAEQDYQDYIHDALAAVRENATLDTDTPVTQAESDNSDDSGKVIYVERDDSPDTSVYVSSSDSGSTPDYDNLFVNDDDSAAETAGQKDADSVEEKKPTPATFDVGTGIVYIDGKYDTTYQANLQKLINDARTGLNYPAFTINSSLGICANLRSKEITCYLSHYRPDGSLYTSLAPDYYKAEIITIDGATEKETLDAWLTDPISRGLIFSKDYTNVGVATYVCNGLNCTVVSFGY